jgi:hypothetical protein
MARLVEAVVAAVTSAFYRPRPVGTIGALASMRENVNLAAGAAALGSAGCGP